MANDFWSFIVDKLPTPKGGGFRYHQPMLLMKAKSDSVYSAGRCPNLCSYELFFLVYLFYAGVPPLQLIFAPPSRRCGGRQGSKGSATAAVVLWA